MRALTVIPGRSGSLALTDLDEPIVRPDQILVRTLAIGVCGTDHEIASGQYGSAPAGADRLVIGHESLAEVIAAPTDSDLKAGDRVVGIVRRPDPVPCANCAVGEWDMCRNGRYEECGIKNLHGFAAERFALNPGFAIKLDPTLAENGVLLEPASVVAKAWEHITRIGHRAAWRPQSALVTGAGPVGLLAALMGRQLGLDVHVFDRVATGLKPQLVQRIGAHYHSGDLAGLDLRPDIVVECTGAASLIVAAMALTGPAGIVCLAGLSSGQRDIPIGSDLLGRTMVLENDVVFGTVNANRRHYTAAAQALAAADPAWLASVITRRVPLARWAEAFEHRKDDVKTIIDFTLQQ
jgi:threonine dehydrogenase-like Zn-dependent dehydrogenase